ncbi:MAG: hypothetical protein A2X31_13130 [Elusimicrobia bacterium GWB2_63_22]|nr:MAG: hypothetical protein A2X31_13130 [Elusimicrobia bacterium GWB2_63_22]
MKKLILNLIALALLASAASASDFDLSGFSASDIRTGMADLRAPAPQAQIEDDVIGVDMNIRVPFKMIKNAVVAMTVTENRLTIIDKNAPVIFKSGEFLRISNITVDQGGIVVVPTLTLKPYFVSRDKFAIRIQRVQMHASMEPSVKSVPAAVTEEQVMVQVMDVLIKGVYSALDAKLKAKNIPLKAQDVVKLNYDKAAWTLNAQVSSKIINQFVPAGIMGDLHLTGFSFSDTGLALKIQTAN